ncbi:hypothetical protein AB0F72_08905 [Actinoplanes sp. NPDC023936]|uniref:hypothetical protein n=1 Tax=Actinoplanes sp. NPDC023936 TaxID=3154910 RepID=UPI0034039B6F
MTQSSDFAAALDAIRYSGDDLTVKREKAFALLDGIGGDEKKEAFRLAADIIFPTPEARAQGFVQFLGDAITNSPDRSDKAICQAVQEGLALGVEMMAVVSEEAAEELDGWNAFLESVIENLPDGRVLECAHCGRHCIDTYAVVDGWTLCLTAEPGHVNCLVRVREHGEPVGAGRMGKQ